MTHLSLTASAPTPGGLHPIRESFAAGWRQLRRQAARLRFERSTAMDAATLRDLGLDRSELGSYQSESEGRVEATRVRVLQQRTSSGL